MNNPGDKSPAFEVARCLWHEQTFCVHLLQTCSRHSAAVPRPCGCDQGPDTSCLHAAFRWGRTATCVHMEGIWILTGTCGHFRSNKSHSTSGAAWSPPPLIHSISSREIAGHATQPSTMRLPTFPWALNWHRTLLRLQAAANSSNC